MNFSNLIQWSSSLHSLPLFQYTRVNSSCSDLIAIALTHMFSSFPWFWVPINDLQNENEGYQLHTKKKIVHKPVCPKAACQCSSQCLAWCIVVSCQNNLRNLTGNPIKQQFTKNNRLAKTVCIPYPYTVWNSTGIEMQYPNSKKICMQRGICK